MRKYNKKLTKVKLIVYVVALLITLTAAWMTTGCTDVASFLKDETPEGNLEVTFIDVDQGDSTLIKTAAGETVLIDGGEAEVYETHLMPFLTANGIMQVDYAVVTHYHSDHMGGIQKLVDEGGAKNLILPDYADTDNSREELEEAAEETGTNVRYMSAGDFLETNSKNLKIKAIHPQKGGSEGSNFHNNSSLVLKVAFGDTDILITGDIERRVEKKLAQSEEIECDILQVAHHGSSSSTHEEFLDEADPTYAIISVGTDNSYGHPHAEIIARLMDEDARIYRTYK